MSLLRWSGLTPPLSDELDVINGGGGSDSELGSGQLLLEDAFGGPGLEASPSVSAGGGAHWPKRLAIIGLAAVRKYLVNVRGQGGAVEVTIGSTESLKHLVNLQTCSGVGGWGWGPGRALIMKAWLMLLFGDSSQHQAPIPKFQTD